MADVEKGAAYEADNPVASSAEQGSGGTVADGAVESGSGGNAVVPKLHMSNNWHQSMVYFASSTDAADGDMRSLLSILIPLSLIMVVAQMITVMAIWMKGPTR